MQWCGTNVDPWDNRIPYSINQIVFTMDADYSYAYLWYPLPAGARTGRYASGSVGRYLLVQVREKVCRSVGVPGAVVWGTDST